MTKTANTSTATSIPSLSSMDVAEQLQVMRHQEETAYRCSDYFGAADNQQRHLQQQQMTIESRHKMCDWCFQIVDFCKVFQHETVEIAMSLLDRFLGTPEGRFALQNQREFQLVAMTTLYMAIKLFEQVQMETKLLAELSRGEYSATQVADMERTILKALQWRVNGPTRTTFCQYFLALLPAPVRQNAVVANALLELTRLQVDLATSDYYFTTRRTSTVAMAIVLNAVNAVGLLHSAVLKDFCHSLQQSTGINPFSAEVQEAQTRLLSQASAAHTPVSSSVRSMLQSTSLIQTNTSTATTTTTTSGKNLFVASNYDTAASSPVCVSGGAQHYA